MGRYIGWDDVVARYRELGDSKKDKSAKLTSGSGYVLICGADPYKFKARGLTRFTSDGIHMTQDVALPLVAAEFRRILDAIDLDEG